MLSKVSARMTDTFSRAFGGGIASQSAHDASTASRVTLKSGEIPGIDGLRAIAVSFVMLGHYGLGKYIPGGFGVTLFFFISGFLITVLMLREHAASGKIAIGRFYMRRLLRLQPELLAFLVLSVAIGVWISITNLPSWLDVAGAGLYVSNYVYLSHSTTMRWPHLWSLAVEEHFYLMYPLVFSFLMPRGTSLLRVLAALCVASLIWRCGLLWMHAPDHWTYVATDARLDSIAYGCLTALILWRTEESVPVSDRWPAALIGVGFAFLLVGFAVRGEFFRESFRYSVQGVGVALFIAGALSPAGRKWTAILQLPAMQWLGRMSYAAYLWHLEPLRLAKQIFGVSEISGVGPTVAMIVVGFAFTYAIAAASNRFVYQSFLPLRRRFGSHAG